MKILLIQPPISMARSSYVKSFPLGLAYVAKEIQKIDYNPHILDIHVNEYSMIEVVDLLRRMPYDIVGIGGLSTSYVYVKWLTSILRQNNKECKIVIGNALATFSPETVLKNTEADICVIGEGEITFREIVEHIDDLSSVRGICFKDGDNIVRNPPRQLVLNLDSLGFPAWDLFPMDIYLKFPIDLFLTGIPVITSRGCPFRCGFCSRLFIDRRMRFRSIENVIEEIRELKRRYGNKIQMINFYDNWLGGKKRIHELCDAIEPFKIKWKCQTRIDTVDLDLLKHMRRTGCISVAYGVESGSQTILDNMNKKITLDQIKRALQITHKAKMPSIVHIIFGYLGETEETLRQTINFFEELDPVVNGFSYSWATPFPGAQLYEYAMKKHLIKNEESYLEKIQEGYILQGQRPFMNLTELDDEKLFNLGYTAKNRINSTRKDLWRKVMERLYYPLLPPFSKQQLVKLPLYARGYIKIR